MRRSKANTLLSIKTFQEVGFDSGLVVHVRDGWMEPQVTEATPGYR